MPEIFDAIRSRVAAYYSAKILEHGPIAKGVDWNDDAGQKLRFEVLSRLFGDVMRPSIAQLGCGYGAFVDYCDEQGREINYVGYDISSDMVELARRRHAGRTNVRFELGAIPIAASEFCIASGIFNVKFEIPVEDWRKYVFATLDDMFEGSTRGFAFNCLTGLSDKHRMVDRLFYSDPGVMLDHCLGRYGRKATLVHDYRLFEFTVMVKK